MWQVEFSELLIETFQIFQILLKHSSTVTSTGMSRLMAVSTDAMSLDGLLDSVSSGSFSVPQSPDSTSPRKVYEGNYI